MIFQIINFIYYTSVNSEVSDVQPHWWLDWKCGHETLYSNDINQSYYVKQIINHIVSKLGKWYIFLYIYLSSLALRIYSIKFISISFSDFVTTVHRAAADSSSSGANLKILFCYYCYWNTYKTEHVKVTLKILQLKIFQHKKQYIPYVLLDLEWKMYYISVARGFIYR